MEHFLDDAPAVAAAPAARRPQHQVPRQRQRYFRIWIVNLLLTIATLGIYSAWAKVRRNHICTPAQTGRRQLRIPRQAAGNFEGRIIALVLIGGYNLAFQFSPLAGVVMLLLLAAVMPFLVWNSLKFRLFYTSYRGIRFGFGGAESLTSTSCCCLLYAGLALCCRLCTSASSASSTPSRYGSQHFSFDATVGAFYQRYLILLGLMLAGGMVFGIAGAMMGAAFGTMGMLVAMGIVYLWFMALIPVFMNMIQNLVWNHTRLGEHRFSSDMEWGKVALLSTNVLGIICTLGLFTPFAIVRWTRYHGVDHALPPGSLDEFAAGVDDAVSATGVGATDMLDFDLSI
jgi:uncharacterized membrane protein YjgN (DUF898 family)